MSIPFENHCNNLVCISWTFDRFYILHVHVPYVCTILYVRINKGKQKQSFWYCTYLNLSICIISVWIQAGTGLFFNTPIGQFCKYDDIIKWKQFPRYWPFVRGIHWSSVNSPHRGQWRGALMFSLICARTNGWANNRYAGDSIRYRAHYGVTIMDNSFSCYGI